MCAFERVHCEHVKSKRILFHFYLCFVLFASGGVFWEEQNSYERRLTILYLFFSLLIPHLLCPAYFRRLVRFIQTKILSACVSVCLFVCLQLCDVCIFDCPAVCYFIDGMGLPMDIATNHGIGGPLAANHLLGAAAMGAINNMAGVHDNRPPPPPHSSLMQMTGMDHNAQCVCSTVA